MRIRNVILSLVAVCFLASCEKVPTYELVGHSPTCWDRWDVYKANAVADRSDWVEWQTMNCGLKGDRGKPVRVLRCDARITWSKMKIHFEPVPWDASLPDHVCQVEVFGDNGTSGIYYTYYFNIERTR